MAVVAFVASIARALPVRTRPGAAAPDTIAGSRGDVAERPAEIVGADARAAEAPGKEAGAFNFFFFFTVGGAERERRKGGALSVPAARNAGAGVLLHAPQRLCAGGRARESGAPCQEGGGGRPLHWELVAGVCQFRAVSLPSASVRLCLSRTHTAGRLPPRRSTSNAPMQALGVLTR